MHNSYWSIRRGLLKGCILARRVCLPATCTCVIDWGGSHDITWGHYLPCALRMLGKCLSSSKLLLVE